MASISLSEGATRFTVWNLAFEGFKERPLLGWGQEGFNFVFNTYYTPELWSQEPWFDRAHNIFLDWLIAGGILGLLGYLSLYVFMLYLVWFGSTNPFTGYYLPALKYKCMTEEYLMNILKGHIFTISLSEVKMAHLKNASVKKVDIPQLLMRAIHVVDPNVKHGLDLKHDTNKEWLVNAYYLINPVDEMFIKY
jgi:hypothetical protein